MLKSQECRDKIEYFDKMLVVKENVPPEEVHLRYHYKNPKIKKVIFNNPATIILWADGTKTVVKCQDEPFDAERGMAMAIAKKYFGNKGNYNNEFKKWVKCCNKE